MKRVARVGGTLQAEMGGLCSGGYEMETERKGWRREKKCEAGEGGQWSATS